MRDKIFIDTNILIYYICSSDKKTEKVKQHLKNITNIYISIQVLNELANVTTRKLNFTENEAKLIITEISNKFNLIPLTSNIILNALDIKKRYKFNYYDCLILSTAELNNCNIVLSEDMHHNQIINNKVKIINPFK